MNKLTQHEVACSICGSEHDPAQTPELDSTHLCATCASAQRALHRPRLTSPVPALVAGDAE